MYVLTNVLFVFQIPFADGTISHIWGASLPVGVIIVTTKMKSYFRDECVEFIICIDLDNKYVRGNKNILIVFTV